MAAVAQQQEIPIDVHTVFLMTDKDESGGISAAEYQNLIISLLQTAGVALGPNHDYQGMVLSVNQLNNYFNTLPNREANLQTFWANLRQWFNIDMEAKLLTNIQRNDGSFITVHQLRGQMNQYLTELADDRKVLLPSDFTPPPEFGPNVDSEGNVRMGGMNDGEEKEEEKKDGGAQEENNPLFIDINKTGHDVMAAEENQNIKAFIDESIGDGERPIIIKIADTNLDESKAMYYLYTYQNLVRYGEDANLSALTVYPCIEANNLATTSTGQDNIKRNEPLLSLQKIINRRINIDRTNFFHIANGFNNGPIFLVIANDSSRTVPSIAKLPFRAGVSELHCNMGAEPEAIWSTYAGQTNWNENQGGGRRRKRKRRRIGTNKKKLKRLQTQYRRFRIAKADKRFKGTKGLVKWSKPSKSKRKGKKRSRRIYHHKRRKTIRKSKSRKRKHSRKH